ncbi:MAG: hypothetical protein AAF907_04235, partial [Planctomycetota bacterium]
LAARGDDPALFHALSVGLSRSASPQELVAFLGARFASRPGLSSEEVAAQNDRLHRAAVVALRRSGNPTVLARAVSTGDGLSDVVALELARAVIDEPTERQALEPLSAIALPTGGPLRDPLVRRVLMANFLLGEQMAASRVVALAADADLPANLRVEAIEELTMWDAPDRIDRVTGRLRPAEEWEGLSPANVVKDGEIVRDAAFLPALLTDNVARLLNGPPEVRSAAVKLLSKFKVEASLQTMQTLALDETQSDEVRVAAVNAVDALTDDAAVAAEVARQALQSDRPAIRAAARTVLVKRDPASAVPTLADALETGATVERQQAVATLASLHSDEADEVIKVWLDKLMDGRSPPEITLELLEAAQTRNDGALGEYLAMYEENRGPVKLDAWSESLTGGSAAAGKEIFFGRSAASCRRCHLAEGQGGEVGPALDGIALKRDRKYLLESIVVPSAKIAEGYATAVVLTEDGQVRTGVLKSETEEAITLVLPTGETVVIPAETVLDRADGPSAMPADIPDSLTKREMRDLVEYLATLKTAPDDSHGEGAEGE